MRYSDIEELIARAAPIGAPAPNGAPADQSGAINFGRIFKGIFGREDDELLARE